MSFAAQLDQLPLDELLQHARQSTSAGVATALGRPTLSLEDFARLLSPEAAEQMEWMGQRAHRLTQQRFGRVIRLFAPLYLSNECINNCRYCGFSRDNPILRVTLSIEEVRCEALALAGQGFRHLLLVAGEHPKFISSRYLVDCVSELRDRIPSISLEVGPMDEAEYRMQVTEGAEGLVVYQETYDRQIYRQMHTAGPKRNFDRRLETPERAHAAGFRRLGIGVLFGLGDWRRELLCLAAHAQYLLRHCWKSQLTLSLPRLQPCAGEFEPLEIFDDRSLVQAVCALRLFLPDAGLVLSTREPAPLRDGLIPLGITMMSAGSHTEPGGYTGAGRDKVHYTERGRVQELAANASEWAVSPERATSATGQFDIADHRPPVKVAEAIAHRGYEPVWKDWDPAFLTHP